jgi:malate dehydrogenase (oxaloacetate-decarboxylating)(NADP+)
LLRERAPDLEVEGEMHADAAIEATIRERLFPNSRLTGTANMFVFPNLDAANICFNMVRVLTGGVSLGPIVMGLNKPCYVLTNSATVRRVINMTALAVVEAQVRERQAGAAG